MPAPPGAVPSVGDDGKPLNMRIASTYGSTDIVAELVHRDISIGPALLAVDSQYGSVTVAVVSYIHTYPYCNSDRLPS
jgi:hypothetical protein